MPQVKSDDHSHLKRYLTKNDVSYKVYHTDPSKLSPTQSDFNLEKVNNIISNIDKIPDSPILISKDNKVIDGHHRWLAKKKIGTDIKVLKINKRYDNVLGLLDDFPKTFNKEIHEDVE